MSFAATPPIIYGTLARYYVLPADLCHPLADTVSFEDGAMMEPLAVGVHSVHTLGKCQSDQNVIVFGAGPVGLLCMAVAKALGARRIIAVDIQQERLDFATSYVATDSFLPVSWFHRGPERLADPPSPLAPPTKSPPRTPTASPSSSSPP
jgi:L-iditol 2-dehydrogenase/D-xylulose reductase